MTHPSRAFSLAFCGLFLIGASLLAACQPKTAATVYPLPELSVGVAPFSQPTQSVELMAGFIPVSQGLAGAEELGVLDVMFREKLSPTGRYYEMLPVEAESIALTEDTQGRRSVLAGWVARARAAGVDLLIVPQVVDWHERVGGSGGVITPASVSADFFLIDARGQGALLQRSHYQEEQEALADNLLTFGDFVQRKGRWLSAGELMGEGMNKAIQEFGLTR